MKVVIFGATGMVGRGMLLECLASPNVNQVLVIARHSVGLTHPKLTEIIHTDFFALQTVLQSVQDFDLCFFSIAISSLGKSQVEYTKFVYDLTLGIAKQLPANNPKLVFCYISAQGADASERQGPMWAQVRGRLENQLLKLPFKRVYIFRPGYIQPLKGVKSKVWLYNLPYRLLKPFNPIIKRLFPNQVTSTVNIGQAAIQLALREYPEHYLPNQAINQIAANGY